LFTLGRLLLLLLLLVVVVRGERKAVWAAPADDARGALRRWQRAKRHLSSHAASASRALGDKQNKGQKK